MSDPKDDVLTRPERLAALAETGLLDALPQESLDRFTRIASICIGAPVALVSLVDDHRQFFSSLSGLPDPWASERETPLSHSFCQQVVRTGEDLIVTDARNDPRVAGNLAIPELGVQAYAGKPIRTSDAHVLGSFCVIDSKPRVWTEQELALLDDLCDAVTAEIELRRRALRYEASERALASANREISESNDASTLVSRQVVHDLRTPLGVVTMGVSRMLRHEAVANYPELGRMLERVSRNAQHAASLLISMESGQSEPPPAPGLSSELSTVAAQVVHDLAKPGRDLSYADAGHGGEPLRVALGETELRRCVENIVSNGLRFASARVLVSTRSVGGEAQVWIDDDGPGLPSVEARQGVWQRNVRYHVEQGLSGSGLGLSIVKEIIERAGGHVEAGTSALGGARFVLALPIV